MAYVRLSAFEVSRICEKFYNNVIEATVKDIIDERVYKLTKRFFKPLSKEKAMEAVDNEISNIYDFVILKYYDDVIIYNDLIDASKLARPQDYITVDSLEIEFLMKYREVK